MRIGILTFTDGTNIGQRLQNYALQEVISVLCKDSEVCTIRQGYPFSTFKRNIKKVLAFLKAPKEEGKRLQREKKFAAFNKRNIVFSPYEMPFSGENSKFSDEFDCFVVGSDQIWNPDSPFVGDNFFLTFARREQRLTYAPSFSVDEIPIGKVELYRSYLNGFDTVTVREDRGAEIVKTITGKNATVVLDPTLLLTKCDYDKIKISCANKPKTPYILAMFLGTYPENDVNLISDYLGVEIYRLDSDAPVGPDEFLDLVEHANLVLTDSYHITIFSILYEKPFVNFMRSGSGKSMYSRFETLYRLLGIEGRTWENVKIDFSTVRQMDYKHIYQYLEIERKRCLRILEKELNGNGRNGYEMEEILVK